MLLSFALVVGFFAFGQAQLALLYDYGEKTANCPFWSQWGPCVWFHKGEQTAGYSSRWGRRYREQLNHQCYRHLFFKKVDTLYGDAMHNVMSYLGDLIRDDLPCGMCSYQQSCGSGRCNRKTFKGISNHIWVAEQLCQPSSMGGYRQDVPCTLEYEPISKGPEECKVWPNKRIELPKVSESKKDLLYSFEMTRCIKQEDEKGQFVCKCCCFPYLPDFQGKKCLLNPDLKAFVPPGHSLKG